MRKIPYRKTDEEKPNTARDGDFREISSTGTICELYDVYNIYVNIAAFDKESGVAEYKYGISTDGINYEYTDMIKESNYSFNSKKSHVRKLKDGYYDT